MMNLKHEAHYSAVHLSHVTMFWNCELKNSFFVEGSCFHMELQTGRNLDPHHCQPVA